MRKRPAFTEGSVHLVEAESRLINLRNGGFELHEDSLQRFQPVTPQFPRFIAILWVS